ncbi:hypothetical protein HYT05_02035 [Candidatus Kaiserbacteria bacterium]|nr:hypothetical protein [Candidatus Kaiserbacteria bacterium]
MEIQKDRISLTGNEVSGILIQYASQELNIPLAELEAVSFKNGLVVISRKYPYRIIRAGLDFCVVLVKTPADGEPEDPGTRYFEYHPGRRGPKDWNDAGFNEVSWKDDARYMFSGQADGMGYAEPPPFTFESLEITLAFVLEEREKAFVRWTKVALKDTEERGEGGTEDAQYLRNRIAGHPEPD